MGTNGEGRSITDRRSITDLSLYLRCVPLSALGAVTLGGGRLGGGVSESGDNGYKVGIPPHS